MQILKLTDKETELVDFLKQEPRTVKEASEHFGIKPPSILDSIQRIRKKIHIENWKKNSHEKYYFIPEAQPISKQFAPRYTKPKDVNSQLFNAVKNTSNIIQSYDMNIKTHVAQFPEGKVCALCFAGDFHIGHTHANYAMIEHIFRTVSETDNLYIALLGDIIDNSVNAYAPKGTTNIVDKQGQMRVAEHLLFEIGNKDKIVYMIEGNHEMRSYLSDHFRMHDWLASEHDLPYGGYGHPFYIRHGDHTYKVFCRHKAKGHSQYNPLQPAIRSVLFEYSECAKDADIVVTAHKHEGAIGHYMVGGKHRIMAVVGNTVNYDDYAERTGFKSGISDYPCVVFYPNGSAVPFLYFHDAVNEVKRLNGGETK